MAQLLYSIAAIMLLGLFVLSINVKIHGTQDRMMFNELALEMTSVGAELLNEIGKHDFDPGTISKLVVTTDSLSYAASFGGGSCDPDNDYYNCFTVGDFHSKAASRILTRVHGGIAHDVEYNVTDIVVQYVSEAPPHEPPDPPDPNYRSFAKEVTLTISTPALLDNDGNPFEIEMSRVYMYPNI